MQLHSKNSTLCIYSYQYKIKIISLPETETHESASATTALCLSKPQETEIESARRIPTRNATPDPKPGICKFTRIAKGQVMHVRRDVCNVQAMD